MHNVKTSIFHHKFQKYKTKSFYQIYLQSLEFKVVFIPESFLTLFAIRYMHSFHDINPYSSPVVAAHSRAMTMSSILYASVFLPVAKLKFENNR